MRPTVRLESARKPGGNDLNVRVAPASSIAQSQLARRLKQKRSKPYVETLLRLDAGTHTRDVNALEEVIAAMNKEFSDLASDQRPLGYVQKCILAPNLEVHVLDVTGKGILKHYAFGEPMPALFAQARTLAIHPNHQSLNTYAFIEIYADRIVPVYADGPVTHIDPASIGQVMDRSLKPRPPGLP